MVLDQVMPGKKGTDLYKEIKNINPSIKAIMLTGEASSDEVGLAMRLGFSNYLNKGEILKLPEIVLSLYIQYEIDILKKYSLENQFYFIEIGNNFLA
ncbi:response regulator [Bacteroides fragilis]